VVTWLVGLLGFFNVADVTVQLQSIYGPNLVPSAAVLSHQGGKCVCVCVYVCVCVCACVVCVCDPVYVCYV
jgi:hypothetical protein